MRIKSKVNQIKRFCIVYKEDVLDMLYFLKAVSKHIK